MENTEEALKLLSIIKERKRNYSICEFKPQEHQQKLIEAISKTYN